MKKCMLAVAALVAAQASFAIGRTNFLNNAVSDWTKPASYADTSFVPGEGDVVFIQNKTTVTLDASNDADSLALVNSLDRIILGGTESRLEINVDEKDEKSVGVSISGYMGYIQGKSSGVDYVRGPIVKLGKGTLKLTSSGYFDRLLAESQRANAYDYYATFDIVEGLLQPYPLHGKTGSVALGRMNVHSDATLSLPYQTATAGGNAYAFNISGDGLVTNCGPAVAFTIRGTKAGGDTADFGGRLCGTFFLLFYNGSDAQNLTGTNSTFETSISFGGQSVVGAKSIGPAGSVVSSLGNPTKQTINSSRNAFRLVYLGDGETCSRGFVIDGTDTATYTPPQFDGGPYGGITFSGLWQRRYTTKGGHNVILTGSNTTACVLANQISDNSDTTDAGGAGHGLYFRKEGAGVWRFADHSNRFRFTGGVSVDEGVLEYTSLANRGTACSIGSGLRTTDGVVGPDDNKPEHQVPYGIRLGGQTLAGEYKDSGRFSYVGESSFIVTNREIAVAGKGGLRNDGDTRIRFHNIYGISSGDMTLYLDGTGTNSNEVNKVSDGANGGKLSVIKDGSGTWVLSGDQTWHGTLTVKDGELVVRNPTNYAWYVWTIKGLHPGVESQSVSKNNASLCQFCLCDANDKVVTMGLRANDDRSGASLDPGEVALVTTRKVSGLGTTGGLAAMFDGQVYSTYCDVTLKGANGTTDVRPDPSDPESWINIMMRLPAGANPAVGYDYAAEGGTTSVNSIQTMPSNYVVQASLDGFSWDALETVETATFRYSCAQFVYQGGYHDYDYTINHPNSKKFAASKPTALPAVLENVSGYKLAGGKLTLEAGSAPIVIDSLTIDAVKGGTLDGFSLAPTGTLVVENCDASGSFDIPGSLKGANGYKNLSDWDVTVKKSSGTVRRGHTVTVDDNGQLKIVAPGVLLIVR